MYFIFITRISNFILIKYYLLFDPKIYFLSIILDYKNLKFKHLIDDIHIDFLFFIFLNFFILFV